MSDLTNYENHSFTGAGNVVYTVPSTKFAYIEKVIGAATSNVLVTVTQGSTTILKGTIAQNNISEINLTTPSVKGVGSGTKGDDITVTVDGACEIGLFSRIVDV